MLEEGKRVDTSAEFRRMISRFLLAAAAASFLLVVPADGARAQAMPTAASPAAVKPLPFVSPIFGDDMVLQRGKPNTLWGWSEPGNTIRVQIGDSTASAIAGADRRWEVKIQPPPAGGPYTLRISGGETIELHNVLVGDVLAVRRPVEHGVAAPVRAQWRR